MFPQLQKDIMGKLLKQDPSLETWILQELDRAATAPPRDRMTYDTFDSYTNERLRDFSIKLVFFTIMT